MERVMTVERDSGLSEEQGDSPCVGWKEGHTSNNPEQFQIDISIKK